MESSANALSKPKPVLADPQDVVSSSSSDSILDNNEYFWEHPNKPWVVWTFEEM
jgi:hypothetical protein